MTEDHRKVEGVRAQEDLADDPGFLREVVERVLQRCWRRR